MRTKKVEKPRIFQDGRDMIISLGVMLIVMFVVIGGTGLCHYQPGNPKEGKVTRVDYTTFLQSEAQSADYPVRLTASPEGWIPNSALRINLNGHSGSSVGWVHDKDWIRFVQTSASVDDVAQGLDSKAREEKGTKDIDGTTWHVFEGSDDDVRTAWVADKKDVRWAVSGTGSTDEFSTMAKAIQEAKPEPSAGESAPSEASSSPSA